MAFRKLFRSISFEEVRHIIKLTHSDSEATYMLCRPLNLCDSVFSRSL